jgi:hypothetical protein
MKNFTITKLALLLAIITLSQASCLKSDTTPFSNWDNTYPFMNKASITDMGPVNDTTRKMLLVLRDLKYELTNDYGKFEQSASVLQFEFFSNQDGKIPTGVYMYSDSTFIVPYTFRDAFISEGGGFIKITRGMVTVSSIGPTYDLLFECGFSDGATFTAMYNGTMIYSDYN